MLYIITYCIICLKKQQKKSTQTESCDVQYFHKEGNKCEQE